MEQYNYQLIERQVKEIIFTKQLDDLCGYSNSFPDYLNVIKNNPDLYQQTLKTFCHQAIEKKLPKKSVTVNVLVVGVLLTIQGSPEKPVLPES